MLGDGNFFRVLSHLIFVSEDWHSFVRQPLIEFESLNSLLQAYCDGDIMDHISKIKWSTHTELQATASLIQLPVYVCTQKMCVVERSIGGSTMIDGPDSKLIQYSRINNVHMITTACYRDHTLDPLFMPIDIWIEVEISKSNLYNITTAVHG